MAEGKDYEAVLTEEDDQNKVPFEGAEEESKEATGRSSEESIELIVAHEWDGHNDESYDAETIRKKQESSLQRTVAWDEYKFVKEAVTATALMNVGKNPLLLSIKISEKLRERAARSEDNEDDFNALAEQVEEFTLRFLDPLKHFYKCQIKEFCENPELDLIFETATKLGQKKFFGHHVVGIILSHRWYTEIGRTWKIDKPGLWLFLQIWCLVDVVLFPLLFSIALILDWITPRLRAMFQSLRRQQEESYSGPVT